MNIENYLKAGYGIIFIETTEIKRCIKSITTNNFNKLYWNPIRGIIFDYFNKEQDKNEYDQLTIVDFATTIERTAIVLENYDQFLTNPMIAQNLLNAYDFLKSKQTCLVIVGTDSKTIPVSLKEFIPVIDFELPKKDEIKIIAENILESSKESATQMLNDNKFTDEEYKQFNFELTDEILDACQGLTYEEIENILAFSMINHKQLDLNTILSKKRQIIKKTGFMDFFTPLPIETLGGLDLFKKYFESRIEPFKNPESIKPKIKAILLLGSPGCLTGDTIIDVNRKQKRGGCRGIRLDTLYYRFNGKHKEAKNQKLISNSCRKWDLAYATKCYSYKEQKQYIGHNKIENVIYSGIKDVYEITTNFGFKIKATKDHPFLTDKGYVSLGDLKKGDKVYTHKKGILVNNHKNGRNVNIPVRQINNVGQHPNARKKIINNLEYTSHPLHRLVVEAHMNNMPLENYLYKLETNISNLKFLDHKLEVHHNDENRKNNTIENLSVLTKEQHASIHMKNKNLNYHKFGPRFQRITKIKYIGKEKTYDIQMKAPNHNFIANGFIVHNCGKSLAAKTLCSLLNWPGIILDVGSLKGSLVGETEAKTRQATKLIDNLGKCILLIDEVDKSLGGSGRGTQHETSENLLGHLLTWSQERTSDAIVVMTANNIDILPKEMLRSGRIDAIFFVNLPNPNEIKHIIQIKNEQWKSNLPTDDQFCKRLYEEKWSGAEIEQLAKDSHYEIDIEQALLQVPILAQFRSKEFEELKTKAGMYKNANSTMKLIPKKTKRQISLN